MAMFATPEEIETRKSRGYMHGKRCHDYAAKTNFLQEYDAAVAKEVK